MQVERCGVEMWRGMLALVQEIGSMILFGFNPTLTKHTLTQKTRHVV
jgi:hypothetical protein